jgi:phosphoenolpyruvate---glycerone phosphotransferase subunit DhaL
MLLQCKGFRGATQTNPPLPCLAKLHSKAAQLNKDDRVMQTETLEKLVKATAQTIIDHAEELTALDSAIGDADHGINMKRGMEAVLAEWPKLVGKPVGDVLRAVGMQLVMKVGGASGPLYGTLALELGKALPPSPSRADFAGALDAAIKAVMARGKSETGQKTMLDVLVPLHEAVASGRALADIKATAQAAAEKTIPMKAIRGRASFLGDRSIGHMDPGSRSTALMVTAICDTMGGRA